MRYRIAFGLWLRVSAEGSSCEVVSPLMASNPPLSDLLRPLLAYRRVAGQRNSLIQYSPLRQGSDIRLFVLHPGSGKDIISGDVEQDKLRWKSERPFEALSYVWGDANDTKTIKIGGVDVSVTQSLEAALRHLRYHDRPRTLWVDYICIDQNNISERNQQVANMGLVYEFSKRVLVWLGEATPDTKIGMDIIQYFATANRPNSDPIWQHHPKDAVHAGLADVLGRPWFQRMWVVQEIGRSKSALLICGDHEVAWRSSNSIKVRTFSRMIKYAELLPQWSQLDLNTIDMQPLLEILDIQIGNQLDRAHGASHRPASDLLDIAYTMRYKQCKDSRDKLYGIYTVPPHMEVYDAWEFPVDYNKTPEEVFEVLRNIAFP